MSKMLHSPNDLFISRDGGKSILAQARAGNESPQRRLGGSRKRGREPKLNPAVEAAIVANIRNCATQEDAAQAAGISYRTLRNWIIWGEKGREPYFHLFQALTRARVEVEYKLVDIWWRAARNHWRAAKALLEQRFPDIYGRQRQPERGQQGLTIHLCEVAAHEHHQIRRT